MSSPQQILSSLLDMQKSAQGNLPVLPNNGNPAGAHNMPAAKEGAAPAAPSMHAIPWMNPSPAFAAIQERLAKMRGGPA